MYRFSISGSKWILRFSAHLEIEDDEKEAIIQSTVKVGPKLSSFSHGDSFLIFDERMGCILFLVEKIPSLILTALAVVPREQWFVCKNKRIEPY